MGFPSHEWLAVTLEQFSWERGERGATSKTDGNGWERSCSLGDNVDSTPVYYVESTGTSSALLQCLL